jgi:hypothetical protein
MVVWSRSEAVCIFDAIDIESRENHMPKPPNYKIIYNWDGDLFGWDEVPQSTESFLSTVYAPLEGTQVDALFWCVATHAARWNSDVVELEGEVLGRKYDSASSYRLAENVRTALERGEDPNQALIQRARELGLHVYASIRMNDNHFDGAQLQDLPDLRHPELTQMRRQHPEWLLGDQTLEWFALSWNLEVPEVRNHRLSYIEEVCRRYDWDGVELDWMRHPFHLPQDDAYRLRYTLTDMQRSVRRMADQIAQSRDRPFYVATRVASSLETCRHVGFDLPVWIEEGLVDVLIPAGAAMTDPSIDVQAFRGLCCEADVVVYPGLDGGLANPRLSVPEMYRIDDAITRGIVSNYYSAEADGIYLFNWYADHQARRELLTTIGSPETLRKKDRTYAATHRVVVRQGPWRGAYRFDRLLGEVPVRLKPTRTGDGPTVTIQVANDVQTDRPDRIELRLRLQEWVAGDVVRVVWNGDDLLSNPDIRYIPAAPPSYARVSDAVWQCYLLRPDQLLSGTQKVKVILDQRNEKMACDMVLTDIELAIHYGVS